MLAAAHGDKRRKKTGATYGKAIRRQGPAHLVTGYDLSNDFQEGKIELPVRAAVPREPETTTRASKKRQSPTTQADVFDFPSDSDSETLSPGRTKKRKLSPKALKPAPLLNQVLRPQKTSPTVIKRADTTQVPPEKSRMPKPGKGTVLPLIAKPKKSMIPNIVRRATTSTVKQDSAQSSLETRRETASPSKAIPNENTLAKAMAREPLKMGKQYSSATKKVFGSDMTRGPKSFAQLDQHVEAPLEQIREDPEHDLEGASEKTNSAAASDTGSSPRQGSPPVLTPKSAKTWRALLGDDEDTGKKTGKVGSDTVGKFGRPPRRRLIDTLIQQKQRAKPESGSSQSSDRLEIGADSSDRSAEGVDDASSSVSSSQTLQAPGGMATTAVPTTSGPRVTYSRQRSMLVEQDDMLSDMKMGSQGSTGGSQHKRGFAPTLLSSFESRAEETMDDIQAAPAIRSVHELRQAGASKRFMDEIDDLCDRITTLSAKPSIRRSALLELLDKVQDKTFMRSLISSGAEQKILATMGHENDEVSAFLLASALLLLLDPTTTKLSSSQLASFGFVTFCRRYLKISDGIVLIAKQRKTNMSKMAMVAVGQRQKKLLELPLWGDVRPTSLSPRTVVLACLGLALPQAPGKLSTHTLVPPDMVKELFLILQTCVDCPLDMDDKTLQCNLLLLMSILGHIYLPHSGNSFQPQWGPEYLQSICCVATKLLAFEGTEMATLRRVVLSLTLNITNNNGHATTISATPDFMHTILRSIAVEFERLTEAVSDDERMSSLDALVLMLGIMINVVEKLGEDQKQFLESSSLRDALQIFSTHAEKSFEADSVEDSHFNVVFGYLAVLLGYLALMEHLTDPIRRDLPGGNLKSLIDAIKEFIYHHQKVDALSQADIHNHSAHTALTDRLSRMLKKVCKVEAGFVLGNDKRGV